mgnify:CR=1 FL=1
MPWDRNQMAARAAKELEDGMYVNLGIGIPTLVANYVGDKDITLQSENGMLGMGPFPYEGDEDPDLINAGKQTISTIPGSVFFDSAESFAMIRGGHVDLTVLGALQVAENGDLANWSTGAPDAIPAVGGAMDLVAGVKTIYVITQHVTKQGQPKLLERCTFPLTGVGVVSRIYSDLAVIDVTEDGFKLVELAPGVDFGYVQERTGAPLQAPD